MLKDFIQQLNKKEYVHGSNFEFDWYIDLIFMEAMAFHNNPIFMGFYQPIIGDEFLDPNNYKKILNDFNDFFQNQKNVNNLIDNQDKIIESSNKLIKKISDNSEINLDDYKKVQKDLAQLMASVSIILDFIIKKEIDKIAQKELISAYQISSYIIDKSSKTKIGESNLKLLKLFKKYKTNTLKEKLIEHSQEYAWLNLDGRGKKEWTTNDFVKQLENLLQKTKQKSVLLNLNKLSKKSSKLISDLIKININDNIASDKQFELDYLFQKFLKIKLGEYYLEPILENLTFEEICRVIENPKSIENFETRKNNYYRVAWAKDGQIFTHYFSNKKEFSEVLKLVHKKVEKQSLEIKGSVACLGKAEGIVHLVKSPKDLPSFKEGEILVASYTSPSYTQAMFKAAAIVTDIGGITSHAAIVSREFNIPCIVGTQNATKLLKNGDKVLVDATSGEVKII